MPSIFNPFLTPQRAVTGSPPVTMHTRLLPPLLAFTALLCLTPSHASAGKKAGEPKFASREQLRACMDSEDELGNRKTALDREQARHTASLKPTQDDSTALYASEEKVDATDEKQVSDFNAKVAELNQRAEAINQRAGQLNLESKQLRADLHAHNVRCASIVFKISDKDAILRERANKKPPQ